MLFAFQIQTVLCERVPKVMCFNKTTKQNDSIKKILHVVCSHNSENTTMALCLRFHSSFSRQEKSCSTVVGLLHAASLQLGEYPGCVPMLNDSSLEIKLKHRCLLTLVQIP